MFKKLQSILFEDDDDELEEAPEEAVRKTVVRNEEPVMKPVQPVETPAPSETVETKKAENVMPRIDVTQPVPVQKTENVNASAPLFDSLFDEPVPEFKEETPAPAAKPLGIKIDDVPAAPAPVVKKTTEQPKKAEKKPERKAAPVKSAASTAYQFKPVISPIFGVDEKDLTAVKNTTGKYNKMEKAAPSRNTGSIISPMYGMDTDSSLTAGSPAAVEEAETAVEAVVKPAASFPKEDDIPEFSLDDILKVRDEEFADSMNTNTDIETPLFPELADDDDLADLNDQTIVMQKDEIKGR